MSKVRLVLLMGILSLVVTSCTTRDPNEQELPWSGRGQQEWMYTPPGMGAGMGGY